jgi:hypothetical protein
MSSRKQNGTVLALPIAVMVVSLLVPVMIARHMQGSHTRGNVARASRGGNLMDAGQSALAEAWWRLEYAATDPTDPLFMSLREGAPRAQTLTVKVPHLIGALMGDPLWAGVKIAGDGVKATIGVASAISAHPREGSMDVKLEVTVKHGPTGLVRTLRESRELRRTLLAVPAPYDKHALLVLDAAGLVGERANVWLEESTQQLTDLSAKIKAAGGQLQIPDSYGGFKDAPSPLHDDLSRTLHRFPSRLAIHARSDIADLSALNLQAKLEAARRNLEALGPAPDQQAAYNTDNDVNAATGKVTKLAQAHQAVLEEARKFQAAYEEVGSTQADELAAFAANLAPEQWIRKATFRFGGAGACGQLLQMLDTYQSEATPKPVSGIVYLDNVNEPLKLSGRGIRGRLVIVATGDVEISDVRLNNRATDLLVVQSEGRLTAHGRVEGALIARGGVQLAGDLELRGALVLDRVRVGDRFGGRLQQDVERMESQLTGRDRPEMFWLTFAPWANGREVEAP